MPIPLAAVAAGDLLLSHLFNKSPHYTPPPSPTFFGPDFQHYLKAGQQRIQAQFGGAGSDIRETLANLGLLNSGALPQALTNNSIQQGQQLADFTGGAFQNEFGAQRGFQTGPGYSEQARARTLDYSQGLDRQSTQMGYLNDIMKIIGGELYKPGTGKVAPVPSSQVLDPSDPLMYSPSTGGSDISSLLKLLLLGGK